MVTAMDKALEIKELDEKTINRIAAGEVIQRPANALKELIENSLDAKTTNIQVTVKEGGLRLLQIQDNGCGIRKEDFAIVCKRFTTSKLREFEDLQTIATYGFRGEALASISHVAHLTIISKTSDEICAYRGDYIDGKLREPVKPLAGNQGTIIIVEDIFYNMDIRRKALKNATEEYQRICDVVSKYAVHNFSVGFSLKKYGASVDIKTQPNSCCAENIRSIYGSAISKELLEFNLENDYPKFKASGFITNPNYSNKKLTFLLFINNRLVDCASLKKSLDQVYSSYLPKYCHPFVYLSLELDPMTIDVNVHPTKHEVNFLNEEQIVEAICTNIQTVLLKSNSSRTFTAQAKLPTKIHIEPLSLKDKTIYPKDMVRTDSSLQKLDKFFFIKRANSDEKMDLESQCSQEDPEHANTERINPERANQPGENLERVNLEGESSERKNAEFDRERVSPDDGNRERANPERVIFGSANPERVISEREKQDDHSLSQTFINKVTRVDTQLTSVLELRKSIETDNHRTLREVFAQHVFVGTITPAQALIQHSTKLFLCNTQKLMQELFYQLILYNFGNFDMIRFTESLSLKELARLALDLDEIGWTREDGDKDELANKVEETLCGKAEMLNEYFSFEISDGYLRSIPLLLKNFQPEPANLPVLIVRLATEVDWETEKDCFRTFAKELSLFYSKINEDLMFGDNDWKWGVEHIFYAALKKFFIPPKGFCENGAILEIADLPNLYKVFERC